MFADGSPSTKRSGAPWGTFGIFLAEGQDVWWDVTAWQGRAQIEAFMNTEPHLSTIGLVDHLCSEASFVDWEQDSSELPDWQTSWRRLVADGRSAKLTNASDANESSRVPCSNRAARQRGLIGGSGRDTSPVRCRLTHEALPLYAGALSPKSLIRSGALPDVRTRRSSRTIAGSP